MTNPYRLENVGFINRDKKISFKFNGKEYFGFKGDTLASALLSNGIHLVGRSFKYHRPRGFFGAGVDEPNAKLQIELNGYSEPNVNATEIELVEGISATSQNCWPSVNFDVGAINNLLNRFFPAGFTTKHLRGQKVFGTKFMSHLLERQLALALLLLKKIMKGMNINTSTVIY